MGSDHAPSPVDGLESVLREDLRERAVRNTASLSTKYGSSPSAGDALATSAPWIATFTRDGLYGALWRPTVRPARWHRARIAAAWLGRLLSSGYRVENESLYRVWNIILVTPILVLVAPVMGIIAGLLLATQGRPVLYRGRRLGKDRKPFDMYKFRTLQSGADKITRDQVLPARSRLETKLGVFLRDCRLDELPQLINVLEGSMNLFGPRPVRPGIAKIVGQDFGGYDERFSVRPGMFGSTQAVMTHRTPKRLRALYNANLLRSKARLWAEPLIVAAVGMSAVLRLGGLVVGRLGGAFKAGHLREQRKSRRVRRTDTALFVCTGSKELECGRLVDINDNAFLFEPAAGVVISEGQHEFMLRRATGLFRRPRTARCRGIVRVHPDRQGVSRGLTPIQGYMVFYGPSSPLNAYLIDKYFLMNALVS